jgi:fucose 4-O-acetylase-like acetyltransferase
MVFAAMVMILLSVPLLLFAKIPFGLLYGSMSYANCGSTLWTRAIIFVVSFSWIIFLFAGVKPYLDKNIFLITSIGQHTWPIFLLHGFVVKVVPIYCPYLVSSPLHVILLSCLILVLFGNRIMSKAVYYVSFSWVEKFHISDQ